MPIPGAGPSFKTLARIHAVTQTKTTAGLFSDGGLIAGDHLDLDTKKESVVNGLLGVIAGRIEDGEEVDNHSWSSPLTSPRATARARRAAHSEFLDVSLESILGLVARARLNDDAGRTVGDTLEWPRLLEVSTLGTLVDGIERPDGTMTGLAIRASMAS
jgi:hypothetical protein